MASSNLKNFGIICKGKSILGLPEIEKKFDECYIINFLKKNFIILRLFLKKKNYPFCKQNKNSSNEKGNLQIF